MPTVNVDLTGVTTEMEALPPGLYEAQVQQVEQKTSKTGNPFLSWRFRLTEGELAGRIAFYNTSLQKQALWNLKRVLIALGYDEEDLDALLELDTDELLGLDCCLTVEPDEFQGKTTGKVTRILPAGATEETGSSLDI